ncbi:MAG: F0F1 ATP synthase subunit B [Cellvibrionales bacterium]|nr:F0F1 ATP synthase subunit B [Cellvibrionales bacterium]
MNINLTLIGQSISFLFFVLFCMKFVWPAITNAMAERAKKIAEGLEAADHAKQDLELAKQGATKKLTDAKHEAQSIIDQANKRANKIVEDAQQQAQAEAELIRTAAQNDAQQELARAKDALQKQVSRLAVEGAEKILESSVDASAHKDMLDKLAAKL